MTKRSVKCLSAALLFGAALLVGACGDDSDSSPPANEGEGEGEGSEGEGEGEGEGQCDPNCQDSCNGKTDCIESCPICPDPCMECINSCGGFTGDLECVVRCSPDPCVDPRKHCETAADCGEKEVCSIRDNWTCQPDYLADYRWFNGTWNCETGPECSDQPTRTVRVTELWDDEHGAQVTGFFRDGELYFKKNPQTELFEISITDIYGTGFADPQTGRLELHDPDTGGTIWISFQKQ